MSIFYFFRIFVSNKAIMSIFELKTDLHHLIDEINDTTVLKELHTILRKKPENEIIGNTANRKPLTIKQFISRIKKAEQQIKKGQYVTVEELEKESETW
jgi:hypothetical protein